MKRDKNSVNKEEQVDSNKIEENIASLKLAQANNLPPTEILFDHLSRIDSMKNELAPAAIEAISVELNNSKS